MSILVAAGYYTGSVWNSIQIPIVTSFSTGIFWLWEKALFWLSRRHSVFMCVDISMPYQSSNTISIPELQKLLWRNQKFACRWLLYIKWSNGQAKPKDQNISGLCITEVCLGAVDHLIFQEIYVYWLSIMSFGKGFNLRYPWCRLHVQFLLIPCFLSW